MNSFEGHPIIITEQRYQELVAKEKQLELILKNNPELWQVSTQKLTPAAKKYKAAFSEFVNSVETALSSQSLIDVFTSASVHGIEYKGPSLTRDIDVAKQVLGLK